MNTEVMRADHPVAYEHAWDVLKNGGLVAFPTDTVYGLAVLPSSEENVERLYVVKGRNSSKAIAVLIGNQAQLSKVVRKMTPVATRLAEKFWPGPMTLVMPGHPALPGNLSQDRTIGVRMPDHPIALTLLRKTGPLAVTSANMSGQVSATTAHQVLVQLGGKIHLVLDGGTVPGGIPSTVVDCTGGEPILLRVGPVPLEAVKAVL